MINRGGSVVNFERLPILNYLKLRQPDDIVYTATEHYMNTAAWYLKQGQNMAKALRAAANAVDTADEAAVQDPGLNLIPQCEARLLQCAVLSKSGQHEQAFSRVYETNRLLDNFWEFSQDAVLTKGFWKLFAKLKANALKCLAIEGEFLHLPLDILEQLNSQRDRFIQDEAHAEAFEEEIPEEMPPVYMFGDPSAALRTREYKENVKELVDRAREHRSRSRSRSRSASPKSARLAALENGAAGEQGELAAIESQVGEGGFLVPVRKTRSLSPGVAGVSGTMSPKMLARASSRHSGLANISGRTLASRETKVQQVYSAPEIFLRAGEKLKQTLSASSSATNFHNMNNSASTAGGGVSSGSPPVVTGGGGPGDSPMSPQEQKIMGLYPGKRATDEDIELVTRGWRRRGDGGGGGKKKKHQSTAASGAGMMGQSPKMQNAFQDFKNNAARHDADTENPKVRAWQLASGVRRDYKRWSLDSKKKGKATKTEEKMLGEEICYNDRVFYSKEGLASMRRRRQIPGMRRRDQELQQELKGITGSKLNVKDLQFALGHLGRMMEFGGLQTDVSRRRALAAMRAQSENLDLPALKVEMSKAEEMYYKFAKTKEVLIDKQGNLVQPGGGGGAAADAVAEGGESTGNEG